MERQQALRDLAIVLDQNESAPIFEMPNNFWDLFWMPDSGATDLLAMTSQPEEESPRPKETDEEVTDQMLDDIRQAVRSKDYPKIYEFLVKFPRSTLAILYEEYLAYLRYILRKIDGDDVDDYIQYAFMRLLETLREQNGWSGNGSLSGWLARVAFNRYLEKGRKSEVSFIDFSNDEGDDNSPPLEEVLLNNCSPEGEQNIFDLSNVSDLEDRVYYRDLFKQIVQSLDDNERTLFLLLKENYRIGEIADILQWKPSFLQTVLHRIRRKILKLQQPDND